MRSLAFFMSAMSASLLFACGAGADGLEALHTDIVTDYKTVVQLSPEDYLKRDPAEILLLDIREPEEYAVSHLPGAIWVSPQASAETALIQIGDVTNKQIVVYCSVGVRSSRFAKRVQEDLMEMGATSVSNLERGIFGWHNDERRLVDAKGETGMVHPYDKYWGRYVKRNELVRYKPE